MSTASPETSNEGILRMEGPYHECLLPKELVIMILVVSGALAISVCLLLGYICRYRIELLAHRCCRSCSRPPSPPPRGGIAYSPPPRDLASWDDAPEASFSRTLTVTLRDERQVLSEERIRLSFSIKADALPTVRATGRRQRPGANEPSADPGACMGLERVPVALTLEPSEPPSHEPAYIVPSPSIASLSSPHTPRFTDSNMAMVSYPTGVPSTSRDQRRVRGSERSRTRSEGNDMT